METPEQKAAGDGTVAVICGVAPIPLGVLMFVPLASCLAGPGALLAALGAIGFGVVGIIEARKLPGVRMHQAALGLVLGMLWLAAMVVAISMLMSSGVSRMRPFD